ncbi:hypothetical protein PVK06_024232 [Gossypium arboreum]|uniref:Uncharacterized protein n=1 Tax=Gossypium arboreum TaxID=29729 RepID=A0ABR0PDC3_GOSAR|nr:hypothetical protein PVK06_024232 [Gossypium arboreum]
MMLRTLGQAFGQLEKCYKTGCVGELEGDTSNLAGGESSGGRDGVGRRVLRRVLR